MPHTVSDLPPYFHVGIIGHNTDGGGTVHITDGEGHGAYATLDAEQMVKLEEVNGVKLPEFWPPKD